MFLHCIASTRYPYFIASPPTHVNCENGFYNQQHSTFSMPFVYMSSFCPRTRSACQSRSTTPSATKSWVSMPMLTPRKTRTTPSKQTSHSTIIGRRYESYLRVSVNPLNNGDTGERCTTRVVACQQTPSPC